MSEPPHPGGTGVDEHGVLLRTKPDPSQPAPDPALVADDAANLLFYAAALAGDPARQVQAWQQLGLADAHGAPTAKMTPFIRANQEWVKLRGAQAATVSTPEKARAYLDAHLLPQGAPAGTTSASARELALRHCAAEGLGEPVNVVAYEHVPGLFEVQFANAGEYVLVHRGAVVKAKGLEALGKYLAEARLLAQPALDVDDLTTLLVVFDAFPPVTAKGPQQYVTDEVAALAPRLVREGGGARLTLSYLIPDEPAGPVRAPGTVTTERWTLEIPATYQLRWQRASSR